MFPNYKSFLWFKGKEDGWKDLGKMDYIKNKENNPIRWAHSFCGTTCHVGAEGTKRFYFCPRCMLKLKGEITSVLGVQT